MGLKELNIKTSYISLGEDNIVESFLIPSLKETVLYRRSVGFFSSGVFGPIMDGIIELYKNGGKIEIIASPQLNEEDISAIDLGYQGRETIVNNAFSRDFLLEIEKMEDSKLRLLATLIADGILDIKIAVTESSGMYHDKLGILKDRNDDVVVFYGSPNESLNGYKNNYEKIRVIKSWVDGEKQGTLEECREFQSLWDNTNPYIETYEYKDTASNNVLKVINKRKAINNASISPVVLRDYQESAIDAWVNNKYQGFFVMATGTGKTWTAIYSAKKLVEKNPAMIVIAAPYKHLVRQWLDDVEKAFPNASCIMVSSENPMWEKQITSAIILQKYKPDSQIIIISTIASFKTERFIQTIKKSMAEKLLIVDEAHRFVDRPDELKEMFPYMLGLSATPFSGNSTQKGYDLMGWFGGQVYNLPIETALQKGFLVPYNYYPIYVYSTFDEEKKFKSYTQKIASCFKNGKCINPELLAKTLRNRLRIISMAEEKTTRIDDIIKKVAEKDHFVVYCGDGKLFDENSGKELRHIQSIKRVLSAHSFKASQFTANENMSARMELVDAFNKGEISALAAIRCLDEGINVPSIKSALILSSNDDYREFVQRRGRILRTYTGKEYANIYDVVVLPSTDMEGWAKIEFRRFHEYARLAINWGGLEHELSEKMLTYGLSMEDIDVYDYDEMEEALDE